MLCLAGVLSLGAGGGGVGCKFEVAKLFPHRDRLEHSHQTKQFESNKDHNVIT